MMTVVLHVMLRHTLFEIMIVHLCVQYVEIVTLVFLKLVMIATYSILMVVTQNVKQRLAIHALEHQAHELKYLSMGMAPLTKEKNEMMLI